MKKLLLIDFMNLMHRAYHAYPRTLATADGTKTNAVYGFTNMLLTAEGKIKPTHIATATEEGPSFRHLEFRAYKKNRTWRKERPEEAEEFDSQVPLAYEILNSLDIPILSFNGFEADDIIGTISKEKIKDMEVIILSSDKDMLQLVGGNVKLLTPARPPYIKEKLYTQSEVMKKYGFSGKRMIDYKALKGDPSDNIPGVYGIGEKSASKLIKEYGTVENIYNNLEKIKPDSLKEKLARGAENAVLSKKLTTIKTDVPVNFNPEECRINIKSRPEAKKLFEKLEFKSLIKKLGEDGENEAKNPSDQLKLV